MNSDETLKTQEAAELLHIHPNSLTRKAKLGEVPARKVGRRWIFVKAHLINWLKGDYSGFADSQVVDTKLGDTSLCQLTKEGIRGGLTSPHQMEKEYADLLKLR
ncbi:helix-turn-helix domain-containing protein [Thiomicrorhabdus indica]|uniref:helix-turn-helix domain-containing protein n=1 Tax=Thiomicrorhabdus indica TaxID=2267253 RepID=UPI002AA76D12|nr:helix-turn-helix domain-containing protein [Thiomicrorhabdus indica]